MLRIPGGRGHSSFTAMVVESVRKRIRPPVGSSARFQTAGGNVSFDRAGSRQNSPLFSWNQGRPATASLPPTGIHCRADSCAASEAAQRSNADAMRSMDEAYQSSAGDSQLAADL